jgi:outer membrane protein TolC
MSVKKPVFVVSFLIFGLFLPACGLRWETALSLAKKNNPQIISAAQLAESARWGHYRSISSFLPQLSANASIGETISGTSGAASRSASYGLSVSQNLFSGFKNYLGGLSARANYDYYHAAQKKTESDLYYQLRLSFVDLAIADENIELLRSILERRENNSAMIELRYESGREDKGAFLRTQADLAEAEYNINAARRSRVLARLKLYQLISAEVENAEDKLEVKAPAKPGYSNLLLSTPSYVMYSKQLEKADLALKQTIGEFLPSISLTGSYRKSGTDWPPASDSSSWSLNFSYSLFPGGSNIADQVIYSAQYNQARQDFIKSRNELRYLLESAYEELKNAVETQSIAYLSLDAAGVRAEIARAKYLNGLISYDEWDRIENDYINAQKNLVSRKKAALSAEAAWYNAFGGYVK